jgi:hypothetical protein
MWNTGIKLLRTSEICERLTPAALPPIERTHGVKEFRIIRDCLGGDQ